MKFISLFSGIGGIDLGLERMGDDQGIPKGFFYPLQSPQSPQTPISGSAAISTRRHHQ